jgi:hydrogenase/urease accessory protein HupE
MDDVRGISAALAPRPPHRGRVWLTACAGLLVGPEAADAHLVTSGAGPFYDGVAHFFVSPGDLLVVTALALAGGLWGRGTAKWLVRLLPAAWMTGTALGIGFPELLRESGWFPGASMVSAGLLLAASPRLPAPVPGAVAAGVGLVHGLRNGHAMAATDTSLLAAGGIVAALGLVALLLAALAASFTAAWQRTAARVMGSWVAAIGILSLAWSFRPPS